MTAADSSTLRRRSAPTDITVKNRILSALLATEYKRLLPKLEHVTLTRGQVIYRGDQDIEEVYFPEEAVVAMVDRMDSGRTVEVGLIGREGIVGINVVLGGVVTPDKVVVQLAGSAMRMKSKYLRKEMRFGSPVAAAASCVHARLSRSDQPVCSLLPVPQHRAAPGALAADDESLCRLRRVCHGSKINLPHAGGASRGHYVGDQQVSKGRADRLSPRPHQRS